MKIALFVHNFPPEFLGGTEHVVLALAKSYEALGAQVVVVAGSEQRVAGGALTEESFEGVRVLRIQRDENELYGLELGFATTGDRITDLLADEAPDAVHVHHWATLGWDLLQRAAALGIPGIATLHDLWTTCPRFFRRPPKNVRCPIDAGREPCAPCVGQDLPDVPVAELTQSLVGRDRMLQRELGSACALVVPSRAQAELVREHLPWAGSLEVVPHGLLAPVRSRARSHGVDVPLRVGSFGNIVPEKGIGLLVEALSNCGEQLELRLAGAVPDPSFLARIERRAAELDIPFVWTGPYGPGDPHPALELDLAIFPSLCQESYGLVVDEALAHGVPVVVSAKGALPERAARGGVVVRSGGVLPLKVTLAGLLRSRRKLKQLRDEIPTEFPTILDAARRYTALLQKPEIAR